MDDKQVCSYPGCPDTMPTQTGGGEKERKAGVASQWEWRIWRMISITIISYQAMCWKGKHSLSPVKVSAMCRSSLEVWGTRFIALLLKSKYLSKLFLIYSENSVFAHKNRCVKKMKHEMKKRKKAEPNKESNRAVVIWWIGCILDRQETPQNLKCYSVLSDSACWPLWQIVLHLVMIRSLTSSW